MPSNLKGEQLPITSFFADHGRRKTTTRNENTAPTKKRKREEMEGPSEVSNNKGQPHATDEPAVDLKPVFVNEVIRRNMVTPLSNGANSRTERGTSVRLPSTSGDAVRTALHGSNSNPIDLTRAEDHPVSFTTPVAMNLAAKSKRRGHVEELRREQLMTPPSTDLVKRAAVQIDAETPYNSRSSLPFNTPNTNVGCFPNSNVVSDAVRSNPRPSTASNVIPPSSSSRTAGFGWPTPGSSVPRAKRKDSIADDLIPPPLRTNSNLPASADNLPASSPTSNSPGKHPVKHLSSVDDDVFTSSEVKISSVGNKRAPILSTNLVKPASSSDSHTFKVPALPQRVHSPTKRDQWSEASFPELTHYSSFVTEDDLIGTSQSQDLRPYIISPPRAGCISSKSAWSTPKSLRVSHMTQKNVSLPRCFDVSSQNRPSTNTLGGDLVASSQSSEIELSMTANMSSNQSYQEDLSPTKVPATAEQFVLRVNHLLRTPTKHKPRSLNSSVEMHANFSTPSRTAINDFALKSSPATEVDTDPPFPSPPHPKSRLSSFKQAYSQLREARSNIDKYDATPPRDPFDTPPKQSLRLFESQTLSPNHPRSFEAWRNRSRTPFDSDSATEFDSDDVVAGVMARASHVARDMSPRMEAAAGRIERPEDDDSVTEQDSEDPAADFDEMQDCDTPRRAAASASSKDELLRLSSTLVLGGRVDTSLKQANEPLDDETQYSDEEGQTPTPLREFLDMFKGDGSFPDDFPESWRY